MLTLMYITNDVGVASIADRYGVDRIFIDMETKDKELRQLNLDTVKSNHSALDVCKIRNAVKKASVLVRVNHIYEDSEKEIDEVINLLPDKYKVIIDLKYSSKEKITRIQNNYFY